MILVAGTNGKTSTARMIDALLRAFGLRVGRYTSPHLTSVTERIALDGTPDRRRALRRGLGRRRALPRARRLPAASTRCRSSRCSTALAYAVFADAPVDVAVVEVGLGGTWDATNVVDPVVAVVTPIGLDHQAYLGDTIEEIAGGEGRDHQGRQPRGARAAGRSTAAEVLLRRSVEVGATVAREGLEFGVVSRDVAVGGQLLTLKGLGGDVRRTCSCRCYGEHQAHNAVVALAAVEAFLGGGAGQLDDDAVRAGLRRAPVAGPARGRPPLADRAASTRRTTRPAPRALLGRRDRGLLVRPRRRRRRRDGRQGRARASSRRSSRCSTRSSSPGPRRRAPWIPTTSARVAADVFGIDRVEVVPLLPDALDRAITLAEESGAELGAAGVLVTGSVVIAGEARALLRGPAPVV